MVVVEVFGIEIVFVEYCIFVFGEIYVWFEVLICGVDFFFV